MIRLKPLLIESIDTDTQHAINEFYDYSFLLKEGRQLNEFNIKDAGKKASDLISFAVKKTGSAVNDASLKIYVAAANKLASTIEALKNKSKDKKQGLMLSILGKIINFFIKNPKLAFIKIRLAMMVLTLIGSAIAGFESSQNPDAFNDIFEKLGIDMDASNVGDANDLRDQLDDLERLNNMNDETLKDRIGQSVADMGMDVNDPQFLDKDNARAISNSDYGIASTDLMNDPAYEDFQSAMDEIKNLKGDDAVRRIENLVKLNRMLSEQSFKGQQMDAKVSNKLTSIRDFNNILGEDGVITGTVKTDSSNQLLLSKCSFTHNGVVISKVQQLRYDVSRNGVDVVDITSSKVTGLEIDIRTRLRQLTQGVPDSTIDKIFSGMEKFSSWNKANDAWRKESVEYSHPRLMELAGISEAGIIQRGVDAVKKVVANVKGATQTFLTSLQAKLGEFMGSIGAAFKDPATLAKLKDQQPHTFVIKGGKIEIN